MVFNYWSGHGFHSALTYTVSDILQKKNVKVVILKDHFLSNLYKQICI